VRRTGADRFDTFWAAPTLALPPLPDANDPWLLEFTSGTTGMPKGVVRTHNNTLFSLRCFIDDFGAAEPDSNDVALAALPISFIYPFYFALLASLLNGLCCVLQDGTQADETVALVARHSVTLVTTVPAMMERLIEAKERSDADVSSLRFIYVGGDAANAERKQTLMRSFDCEVRDIYGLTECTLALSTPAHAPLHKSLATTGTVCPGVDTRLAGEDNHGPGAGAIGQLLLRSPSLMAGYYRNEEATRAAFDDDGWFSTGDLATADEDGYFRIVGRKKEVIIRGGANIVPQEIEEWLLQHPEVQQTAAFGMPDTVLGEVVWCCARLRPQGSATEMVLRDFLRSRIASYKVPERIIIVDDLPVSATGKILRRQAKERYATPRSPTATAQARPCL
jgi:acyl-coenzyme A synthetase/AMP-(fatty) acid ligase